jgi:hypothetical protein
MSKTANPPSDRQENVVDTRILVIRITLALALVILALAAVPILAGPWGNLGHPPYGNLESGGGNLVSLW